MLKILITKHLTEPVQKVSQAPTQGAFFMLYYKYEKYSQPRQIKTVTETPTKTRRFATTRPEEPKITLEEYISDFKVRMQINNYEVMEFLEDVKKFYNTTSPHVVKFYNYLKDQVQSLSETKPEDKTEN